MEPNPRRREQEIREERRVEEERERYEQEDRRFREKFWPAIGAKEPRELMRDLEETLSRLRPDMSRTRTASEVDRFHDGALQRLEQVSLENTRRLDVELKEHQDVLTSLSDELAWAQRQAQKDPGNREADREVQKLETKLEGERAKQTETQKRREELLVAAQSARERIDQFFTQARSDVTSGLRTPLWQRQKLWAAIFGSLITGVSAAGVIGNMVLTANRDKNDAASKTRDQLLQEELKVDERTFEELKQTAARIGNGLRDNGRTQYLPWLRNVAKNFTLGLATLRELVSYFDLDMPVTASNVPFEAESNQKIEKYMLERYRADRAYTTVLDALMAVTDAAQDTPEFPERSHMASLTAAQMNWFVFGVLNTLKRNFQSGEDDPPAWEDA